ncbi:hypothetical protein GCM10010515_40500 [Streptomyces fructofermentans]|uniref:Uncharacterized protein n=1 Tax=Streptomyces fructofermentans TaxID=152141 RepID=A0A918KMC6_9ACTN|nr:hypothetical protein GCM10010515_40500 [Streptomyces fructofermentans]
MTGPPGNGEGELVAAHRAIPGARRPWARNTWMTSAIWGAKTQPEDRGAPRPYVSRHTPVRVTPCRERGPARPGEGGGRVRRRCLPPDVDQRPRRKGRALPDPGRAASRPATPAARATAPPG